MTGEKHRKIRFISSITEVDKHSWNLLWPDYPFTRHEFLLALENNRCTTAKTGWQVSHLVVEEGTNLLAAAPLYLKTDSWGEFVFDWAWANAYERSGLNYYPKLVNAIPFTPATGPRIGYQAELSEELKTNINREIILACQKNVSDSGGSGFHCLFPDKDLTRSLKDTNLLQRFACQFHWFNNNYHSFNDFLGSLNSRKRKAIKRERQKTIDAGVEISTLQGDEVSKEDWHNFFLFYHTTYIKKSGALGYLNKEFFEELAHTMPQSIVMVVARKKGRTIASALCFKDKDALYGRYWGCSEEVDCLHFELCYYQGIEYAIEKGLQRFDSGAQGEHKIQRGFTPVYTTSFHHLENPDFHCAVAAFVKAEKQELEKYMQEIKRLMPFKSSFNATAEMALISKVSN